MTITFTNAKVTLTQSSATAFKHIKKVYGSTTNIGTHKDNTLQIVGSVRSFTRLIRLSSSEASNAMSDVEYLAYKELCNKLQDGIADYET
jgi:hypothetical protein